MPLALTHPLQPPNQFHANRAPASAQEAAQVKEILNMHLYREDHQHVEGISLFQRLRPSKYARTREASA